VVILKQITSNEIKSIVKNLNATIIKSTDEVQKSAPSFRTIVDTSNISYTSYKILPSKLNIFFLNRNHWTGIIHGSLFADLYFVFYNRESEFATVSVPYLVRTASKMGTVNRYYEGPRTVSSDVQSYKYVS
jgi:hypothetical protein